MHNNLVQNIIDLYVATPRHDFRVEDLIYGIGISPNSAHNIMEYIVSCEKSQEPEDLYFSREKIASLI